MPSPSLILQVPLHESYGLVFLFSVLGYIGLGLVLTLVRTYGALAAVTGKCPFLLFQLRISPNDNSDKLEESGLRDHLLFGFSKALYCTVSQPIYSAYTSTRKATLLLL